MDNRLKTRLDTDYDLWRRGLVTKLQIFEWHKEYEERIEYLVKIFKD